MNLWRVLSAFFIIGFFKMSVYANDTMKHESLVASFSGVLQKCVLQDYRISIAGKILDDDSWSHVYWPSYDEEKERVYFVARSKLVPDANPNIYSISLLPLDKEPKKLIDNAKYPSLSPNSNLLAFYRHPNQLWIQNLKNMNAKKAVIDFANYQPCVWVSNTHLLYVDSNNQLVMFDVSKGQKQKTGYRGIIPGALSPDGKKVLCGSADGMKIYFYFPLSNNIEPIKESKFRSMGTSFIWLRDGSGFLFTRQTWSNILRLNESRDLFLYFLSSGEESFLLDKTALFGGAFIPFK